MTYLDKFCQKHSVWEIVNWLEQYFSDRSIFWSDLKIDEKWSYEHIIKSRTNLLNSQQLKQEP